jgi:hypothetical protein
MNEQAAVMPTTPGVADLAVAKRFRWVSAVSWAALLFIPAAMAGWLWLLARMAIAVALLFIQD